MSVRRSEIPSGAVSGTERSALTSRTATSKLYVGCGIEKAKQVVDFGGKGESCYGARTMYSKVSDNGSVEPWNLPSFASFLTPKEVDWPRISQSVSPQFYARITSTGKTSSSEYRCPDTWIRRTNSSSGCQAEEVPCSSFRSTLWFTNHRRLNCISPLYSGCRHCCIKLMTPSHATFQCALYRNSEHSPVWWIEGVT